MSSGLIQVNFPQPLNIWQECCDEIRDEREKFLQKERPPKNEFFSTKHATTLCDTTSCPIEHTEHVITYDPETMHPSTFNRYIAEKQPTIETPPKVVEIERSKLAAEQYVKKYIYPLLREGMIAMLDEAKVHRAYFLRKRTRFNACDFLTEYLYNNNPNKINREKMPLLEIPFVSEHLQQFPRKPLPLSLIWTEEEAAIKLQSFYRGHLVRRTPEIAELREWQKQWREDNKAQLQADLIKFFEKAESSQALTRPRSSKPRAHTPVFPGRRPRTTSARLAKNMAVRSSEFDEVKMDEDETGSPEREACSGYGGGQQADEVITSTTPKSRDGKRSSVSKTPTALKS